MSDIDYDYDNVIDFCKNEGVQGIDNLSNSLNNLCDAMPECESSFHSINKTDAIGEIYSGFSDCIGNTNDNSGLAGLLNESANIINTIYSEAMTDKNILENGISELTSSNTSSSSSNSALSSSSSSNSSSSSTSDTSDNRSIEELREYFGLSGDKYIDNKFAYYMEDLTNAQTEVLSKLDQFGKENNISTEDMKDWAWIMCRESGLNPSASNGSYSGLGQMSQSAIAKYSSSGDYATNVNTQISAAYAYIMDRYGSISAAKEHWEQNNWY